MKKYVASILTLLLLATVVMLTLRACGNSVDISKINFERKSLINIRDDIEENRIRAREEYEGKYVSVSGEIESIDEKLFSIVERNGIRRQSVYFDIKRDEMREKLKKLSVGDKITVKGKIIGIGQYFVDIDAYEIISN